MVIECWLLLLRRWLSREMTVLLLRIKCVPLLLIVLGLGIGWRLLMMCLAAMLPRRS
jgi:hypothetical protein